ncbi:hypothetical protein [Brevibacillus porteri]|uniref:Uncharacterized protein n=1 Tax=Brevibacillus porteri TaxID=2126350 RepID=A0ABX5FHH6_9BACL|nr:hypothetical protein [Brevibacillus porteri]MED1802910.1 hypothetical protein [Brevibacillus porteri]MED2135086.1 hypothetical protein [Brevibacillus porteri]MED2746328.1 hypothetical protein [Brevibacillus porteri]MED2817912.1 hypothetical protein [Brevibacillus porteri]MED2895544.1 hypothetical protein [Brevibacillus porteri]
MDYYAMAVVASAATTKLAAVIEGTRRFFQSDYVQFRQIVAELKRDRVEETAEFARHMDEVYRCVARLDELRRKWPENSRPIRREMAKIAVLLGAIDLARDHLIAKIGQRVGG